MSQNPYLITGPALISFSGGRTSAYMLYQIIQAHGGTLPEDVVVTFANTGKEREETLRFVHECGSRWGVHVVWLEWRDGDPCFAVVGYNSASREGEPFSALIAKKRALPNWQARWCTGFLKVAALHAFMRSLGHTTFKEVIGLRADEGPRLLKMYARNDTEGRQCVAPFDKANVGVHQVMAFWNDQSFDLALRPYEGNCDNCFLKGKRTLKQLIRDRPASASWWIKEEDGRGVTFDRRNSYRDLAEAVRLQPSIFDATLDDDFSYLDDHDVECGLLCEPEDVA
jgi:3'-phosphoadenosine 5'-phosphosulfate sulfotransferase (PAPS reductase)/FAD synthetase